MQFMPYSSAIRLNQIIMKIVTRNSNKGKGGGSNFFGDNRGKSNGGGYNKSHGGGRGKSYGGGRNSGGGSSSWKGSRSGEKPESFKAVCGECDKDCYVPFRPNGNKPVLCSFCFRGADGNQRTGRGSSDRRSSSKDTRPSNPDLRREMAEVNKKLDTILEILTGALDGEDDFEDEDEAEEIVVSEEEKIEDETDEDPASEEVEA
jgi:CxxC-x17-CxxC domain-containing protein